MNISEHWHIFPELELLVVVPFWHLFREGNRTGSHHYFVSPTTNIMLSVLFLLSTADFRQYKMYSIWLLFFLLLHWIKMSLRETRLVKSFSHMSSSLFPISRKKKRKKSVMWHTTHSWDFLDLARSGKQALYVNYFENYKWLFRNQDSI